MSTTDDEIERLYAKLDEIQRQLTALTIAIAKHRECPNPGACLEIRPIVEQHSKEIMNLRLWQAGMMAVILCLGFVIAPLFTILGPAIRVKLGLP